MKKIYGFAFAAALVSLASCSNENEPNVNPNPDPAVEGGYLAVNIATPAGTRGEAAGLEEGVEAENYAESGTFLFFKGDVQTQIPQSVLLDWKTQNPSTTPAGVEKVSEAVVVVAGNSAENKPDGVLVILNDPNGASYYNNMTLPQVLAETAKANVSVSTTKSFVMTNATYFVDGEAQIATPIADKVKPTRKEAGEDPVSIFVERLAAKVNPVKDGNFTISSTDDFQVNGMDGKISLTPVITGIGVANIAEEEFLFKQVKKEWISDWAGVNESDNYRSNWAVTPETKYANMSYVGYDATLGETGFVAENLKPVYIKENTSATKSAVLVTAELNLNGKPIEALVRWAGLYFTPASFTTQALNFVADYYKKGADNKYVNLAAEDLAYLSNDAHEALVGKDAGTDKAEFHAYEQALQVKEDVTVYKKVATWTEENPEMEEVEVSEVNDILLQKVNRCWYWNGGKSYYFVPIEHYGPVAEDSYDYSTGVVRNHVYNVNIKSLSGLGVPVFNPNEIIIPEKVKDDLWYMGAEINILKWKLVKQDADFNDVPL